jgi:hypothetical protein
VLDIIFLFNHSREVKIYSYPCPRWSKKVLIKISGMCQQIFITLLPKSEDAMVIQKFRPISLMNTSLKMVTKGMNNRLARVAKKIIDKSHTTFMQNRYIMEGVSMLH